MKQKHFNELVALVADDELALKLLMETDQTYTDRECNQYLVRTWYEFIGVQDGYQIYRKACCNCMVRQ